MKHISTLLVLTVLSPILFSCNGMMTSEEEVNAKSLIVQDSLINILPTWQSLKIKVGDNNTSMLLVVGDAKLYQQPDDVKRKKADEVGKLVLRVYGKGNYLEKGKLIVTADTKNKSENPSDGVEIPIDFVHLKKEIGQ